MNCLFSNSLLEDPAAAAVPFDVTGAVGSYVITQIFINVILQQTLVAAWLHQKVLVWLMT
jgi:hypothetical protein